MCFVFFFSCTICGACVVAFYNICVNNVPIGEVPLARQSVRQSALLFPSDGTYNMEYGKGTPKLHNTDK